APASSWRPSTRPRADRPPPAPGRRGPHRPRSLLLAAGAPVEGAPGQLRGAHPGAAHPARLAGAVADVERVGPGHRAGVRVGPVLGAGGDDLPFADADPEQLDQVVPE